MNNPRSTLIEAVESGMIDWEGLCREFIAAASFDDCNDIIHTLGLDASDEEEEQDEDDEGEEE